MSKRYLHVVFCFLPVLGIQSIALGEENNQYEPNKFYFITATDTILSGADIESFNRCTGRLVLTTDGYFRWTSYVNHLRVDNSTLARQTALTDAPFRLEYLGKFILEGRVNSGYESELIAGVSLFDSEVAYSRGRLSLRYWRLRPGMSENPLDSEEFLEYFRLNGKLVDWQIDR